MQTFEALIKNVTFSFVRVTYGKGDLWYHVSFEKNDKRIPFRMTTDNDGYWRVMETKDFFLLEVENNLCECIKNFETKISALPGKADTITLATKLIK